jgi:hypothetical protein
MNLVNETRIDIVIGIIYVNYHINKYNTNFHKDLYIEHKRVWNNLKEKHYNGEKDFINRFNTIIESIKKEKTNLVTVDVWKINNSLWVRDGFHRISTLLSLNLKPNINIIERNYNDIFKYGVSHMYPTNIDFFKNRGLHISYCDYVMKTYLKNHMKNFNCVILFPNNIKPPNFIEPNKIIYEKVITDYTDFFIKNFIQILYYNEKWCRDGGFIRKSNRCFKEKKPFRILFIEKQTNANLINIKNNIRNFYKTGKDSVHTPDTQDESNRLLMLLNANTVKYLNIKPSLYINFPNFIKLYNKLSHFCNINNIDTNCICITSSAVLSIYGIRDCADIDLFIDKKYEQIFASTEFDNHNSHTIQNYYPTHFENIIHNPNNHFLFFNFKVCNLDIIHKYKKYRIENKLYGEKSIIKDKNDINNIKNYII